MGWVAAAISIYRCLANSEYIHVRVPCSDNATFYTCLSLP